MAKMIWAKLLITCLVWQLIGTSEAIPVQESKELNSTIRHKKSIALEASANCAKSDKSSYGLSLAVSIPLKAVTNTLSAIGGYLLSAVTSCYNYHDHYRKRRDISEGLDDLPARLGENINKETPAADIYVQSTMVKQNNQQGQNDKGTNNKRGIRRVNFEQDDKSSTAVIFSNVKDSGTAEMVYNYSLTREDMRLGEDGSET